MMVSRTMSLGTHEIGILKETLNAQQELLQRLYNELDVERESSAIAADETLSMILRLQGEKAGMEMEASQYKRIVEEKMFHAQETLETFQELIYQKEMQIASLEFQVQAYKFKLSSLGFDDLASCEVRYPENMLLRKNGQFDETSSQCDFRTLRRGYSLPPRVNNVIKTVQENTYWEEIKKLDERVKGFTCLNSSDITDGSLDFHEKSEKMLNVKKFGESQCSTIVQDTFEVPQCSDNHQSGTFDDKVRPGLSLKNRRGNIKLDSGSSNEEKQSLVSSLDSGEKLLKSKVVEEKIEWERKPLLSPKDGGTGEKQKLFGHPTFGVADFEPKQYNRRLKQLEDERLMARVDENNYKSKDEELKLLRGIMERVEAMQSEIKSWRTKKPPPPPVEERSFGCFKEVMLCFLP